MIIGNSIVLILFLLIPIIILLHIIFRRIISKNVSSLFIWEKILKKKKYKFPTVLLLLFQILVISGLILALAEIQVPFTLKLRKENIVLVIDNSASMNVIEDGKSRLDDAKEKAIKVIKNSSGKVMIISSSYPPRIISSYNQNRKDLLKSIGSIRKTDQRNGIEESMKIASASISPSDSIIMISDGAFDYIPPETRNFKFIRAGQEKSYNLGITEFSLRKKINTDSYELYLAISNYSLENIKYKLEIRSGNNTIENFSYENSPGEIKRVILDINSESENQIEAELVVDDLLKSDNIASTYISSNNNKSILLVSPGNFFLEKALESIPGMDIERFSGMLDRKEDNPKYNLTLKDSSGIPVYLIPDNYDVVIFDRIPPPERYDSGKFFYIDSIPSGIRTEQQKVKPQSITENFKHPILDSVNFHKISILKAWPPIGNPQIKELVSGGNTGLLYTHNSKYLKFIYLPFDLTDSDLPLQSSFPILIKNSINWLSANSNRKEIIQFQTGDSVITGTASTKYEDSLITDPEGGKITISDNVFSDTIKTGLYKFEYGMNSFFGSVNLIDNDESNISSRFPEVTENDKEEKTGEYKFPIISLLLLLSLILLTIEWFIQENKW